MSEFPSSHCCDSYRAWEWGEGSAGPTPFYLQGFGDIILLRADLETRQAVRNVFL